MAPHSVEESPAGIACNPGDAGVKVVTTISSPTDYQPPPRKEGEAVEHPGLRQIRDGAGVGEAGVGGRAREQFHTWKIVPTKATDHQLPWWKIFINTHTYLQNKRKEKIIKNLLTLLGAGGYHKNVVLQKMLKGKVVS